MGMVDVTEKPVVHRRAEALGKILLSPKTMVEIKAGRIKKGDPLQVATITSIIPGNTFISLIILSITLWSYTTSIPDTFRPLRETPRTMPRWLAIIPIFSCSGCAFSLSIILLRSMPVQPPNKLLPIHLPRFLDRA